MHQNVCPCGKVSRTMATFARWIVHFKLNKNCTFFLTCILLRYTRTIDAAAASYSSNLYWYNNTKKSSFNRQQKRGSFFQNCLSSNRFEFDDFWWFSLYLNAVSCKRNCCTEIIIIWTFCTPRTSWRNRERLVWTSRDIYIKLKRKRKVTLIASSWHSNPMSASPEGRPLLSNRMSIFKGRMGLKNWKQQYIMYSLNTYKPTLIKREEVFSSVVFLYVFSKLCSD